MNNKLFKSEVVSETRKEKELTQEEAKSTGVKVTIEVTGEEPRVIEGDCLVGFVLARKEAATDVQRVQTGKFCIPVLLIALEMVGDLRKQLMLCLLEMTTKKEE